MRCASVPNATHRRRHHPDAHEVAEHRIGCARGPQSVVDHLLEVGIDAEPPESFGKVHPREAPVELLAPEHAGLDARRRAVAQKPLDEILDAIGDGGVRLNVNDG